MTRGSVQKSVVVLSRLPLYGQIQVKMSLITQAYFQEGDFTHTDIIRQTYQNLNDCLTDDMLHTQQLYVGLSGSCPALLVALTLTLAICSCSWDYF